jgi:hypothetical protein
MCDELNNIEIKFPLNIICNLQDSTKTGSHWTKIYCDDNEKIFYCPFGSNIPKEIKKFLLLIDDRPILTSDLQTQPFDSDQCGPYCLLILYLLNRGLKFEDIILELK